MDSRQTATTCASHPPRPHPTEGAPAAGQNWTQRNQPAGRTNGHLGILRNSHRLNHHRPPPVRLGTDGFNHLYRVYANGSGYQQLTRGEWEVAWNRWIDRNRIVYASTEVDPGERHLYMLNVRTGNATKLTNDTGYRDDFVLSADKPLRCLPKNLFQSAG